ncbi:MAG: GNAT family N-acetyltransferase [Bacillota bacterium]|nr:MAG: GNAT family N-acetyltransferase [Bacillota bacterium]
MGIKIRTAAPFDAAVILQYDKHIAKSELNRSIAAERVYVAESETGFCGWLRYNLFWDNTPFLNMLFVVPEMRKKGAGTKLLFRWESELRAAGYRWAMTSTAAAENARYFYEKAGYTQCGEFFPADDDLELLFKKKLY